ncbi:MAG TPA: MarR family transcriptional regulator, partial [Burkholderiaceae bacterium]
MTTLEERFSGALHNTSRAWKAAIDRRLKYLGMSQASWTTIAAIAKSDAPMSQIELANKLGIEAATMVTMIDRLSKAGLILREASPVDRRVKLIVLTGEGKKLFAKVKHEADIFRTEL